MTWADLSENVLHGNHMKDTGRRHSPSPLTRGKYEEKVQFQLLFLDLLDALEA